jgi:O-acetyl-ADP-ribose deacetylase (regulator of RNase III)
LQIGTIHYYKIGKCNYVVNLPTKNNFVYSSKLEYVGVGLDALIEFLLGMDCIKTVAIPKLGCGLGGLNWDDVKGIIIEKFSDEKIKNKNLKIFLLV